MPISPISTPSNSMSFSDILNLEQKKLEGPNDVCVVPCPPREFKSDMHMLTLYNLVRSHPGKVINYSVLMDGTIIYSYDQKSIG